MADYDLGTAHGRIVVDYDDKGIGQAEKDFDSIGNKAKELLGRFGELATGWRARAQQMSADAKQLGTDFVRASQGMVIAGTAISVLNGNVAGTVKGIGLIKEMGTALGALPKGAERYPSVIQNIIRVSAAISLFRSATGLLASATRNIAGISTITRGLSGLSGILSTAAAPLRAVSSVALGVLTVFKGFAIVKQYAKYLLAFNASVATLGSGLKIIGGVAQGIKELSGAFLLLPAVLGAAGLGMAAFKIGVSGVGDAIKASLKDPTTLAANIKDLSKEAQLFVAQVTKLKPSFDAIKMDTQQALFAGLGKVVADLGGLYLPLLQARLSTVAGSFNTAAKQIAEFFNNTEVANDFGEGLDFTATAVDNITKAFGPLLQAFYMIWRVGTEVLADITKNAGSAAERFAEFVKQARASGALEAAMRRGVQAVRDLYNALVNIGKIAATVFRGLGIGTGQQSFLAWLRQATEAVNTFLNSAQGQQILAAFGAAIANASEHSAKLADVFLNQVLPAILKFLPFIQQMSDAVVNGLVAGLQILSPIFSALGDTLSAIGPALGPIVTVMVTMGTVFIGLGLAAKIATSAIALFRTGVLLINGITGAIGVIGRLTGQMRLAAAAGGLIKGAAIAAGLFLIADGLDKMNLAAVGGDPSKLTGMSENLHDLVGAGKDLIALDFDKIFGDIQDQMKQTSDTWANEQAPIQKNFDSFVTTTQTSLGQVGTFFSDIGSAIGTRASDFVTKTGESFSQMGTTISTAFETGKTAVGQFFTDVGTTISTKAGEIWQSFLTGAQNGFAPVKEFFSKSPFEMGLAIGEKIGDFLKIGVDIITNIQTGAQTKFEEFRAWVGTIPGIVGAALAEFGTTLYNNAVAAWEQFKQGATTKANEGVEQARQIPTQIGTAISDLGNQLATKASEAWERFKTEAKTRIDTAVAEAQALPGRVSSAIATLAAQLAEKARVAWESFKGAAIAKGNEIIADARAVPGKIVSAIGNLGSLLVNQGRAIIDGLLSGIKAGVQAMYDFVSGIAAGIAARKGPLPKDRILLVPAGNAIIQGLITGLKQSMPELWKMIQSVNGDLAGIGIIKKGVNLSGSVGVSTIKGGLTSSALAGSVRGGDGAVLSATGGTGDTYNMGNVVIPASDVKEMQDVSDFFVAIQQKARAGKCKR